VIKLHRIFLDREKGTGLNFAIRDDSSQKSYFIKKYHIYDPKTGKILIRNITHLKEKNKEKIETLELGSSTQSLAFITDIPNCCLIQKRKPIFKSDNIYYIPSGCMLNTKEFCNEKRVAFTRGKKLVCELYLPSTLFQKIVRVKNNIIRGATFKLLKEQHNLFYKKFVFTSQSNSRQENFSKNKEFLTDMKCLKDYTEEWRCPPLNNKVKENILKVMQKIIRKYEKIKLEG